MNKCLFEGNIAKEIEIRQSNSGKFVVVNQLAIRSGKGDDGKTIYEYVPFMAYDQKAEFIKNWFKRGSAIRLETHYHEWKANDGTYKHSFIVDAVDFPAKDFQPKTEQNYQQPVQQTTYQPQNAYVTDDLPF